MQKTSLNKEVDVFQPSTHFILMSTSQIDQVDLLLSKGESIDSVVAKTQINRNIIKFYVSRLIKEQKEALKQEEINLLKDDKRFVERNTAKMSSPSKKGRTPVLSPKKAADASKIRVEPKSTKDSKATNSD